MMTIAELQSALGIVELPQVLESKVVAVQLTTCGPDVSCDPNYTCPVATDFCTNNYTGPKARP
jgi:hypothetical protein